MATREFTTGKNCTLKGGNGKALTVTNAGFPTYSGLKKKLELSFSFSGLGGAGLGRGRGSTFIIFK